MLVHDLPEARGVRIVGDAFEHQGLGAVGKRPVDDIGVARHPADIGGAPVDVAVMIIEHILVGDRGIDEIAAGGVQYALGLAGRTGGVEDEEGVLGVHLGRRTIRLRLGHFLVVPEVASGVPLYLATGALHHQHLDGVAGIDALQRGIGIGLQGKTPPAAHAFIGGNDEVGLAVVNAPGERVG